MNPRIFTSLAVTALGVLVSALTIIRTKRKNDTLLRMRRNLILAEEKLKAELAMTLSNEPHRRETWARPIFAEIKRLDFNVWRKVNIGDKQECVLTQAWNILEWLCIRNNPLFSGYAHNSEKSGAETNRRVLMLRNSKDLTEEGRAYLESQLNQDIAKRYREIMVTMKEYKKLREDNGNYARPAF